MVVQVYVPTPEELEVAKAGTFPLKISVPMKPRPIVATMYCGGCEPGWIQWEGFAESDSISVSEWYRPDDFTLLARKFSPIQPGDTVVLGEEWWRDTWLHKNRLSDEGNHLKDVMQPASTMPVELARFRFTAGKSTPELRNGVWGWEVKLEKQSKKT